MTASSLVGRDGELAALADLLADHRCVTVTGPGGVGKTRLATAVIEERAELEPDGVRAASFAGVPAGANVDVLCGRLGFRSPDALALSLPDDALLVLDDCEHVAEGAAALVDGVLAARDRVSVLATSREPLGVADERLLVLPPLEVAGPGDPDPLASPAVRLFYERAEAAGGMWARDPSTAGQVAELCRHVDALPLAIELAAPRARSLSPRDLLDLMEHRLDVLASSGRHRDGRSRSMSAAIEISFTLLDAPQRALIRQLAVLPAPFDVGLVQAMLPDAARPVDVADRLGDLVARSLLVASTEGPTTYRLLELVRDYAVEELRAAREYDTTMERLTDVLVDEADALVTIGLQQWSGDVISRISRRTSAFVAAIGWCIDHDDTAERALRLCLPMIGGVHQSRSPEIRESAERMLERWPSGGAPLYAEGLALLATARAVALDAPGAEALASKALVDPAVTSIGEVMAHRALVLAHLVDDDVESALHHARAGRAAAGAMPPFARELLAFESSILDRRGDSKEALELAERCILQSDEAHDRVTELFARLVAATVCARAEWWDLTQDQLRLARPVASAIDTAWPGGSIFRSRTMLALFEASELSIRDGWAAAVPSWVRAVERCAERGEMTELALTLDAAALVAARLDQRDLAEQLAMVTVPSSELVVHPPWFASVEPPPERRRAPRGMSLTSAVEAAVTAIGASVAPDEPPAPEPAPVDREAALAREGDGWSLTFGGATGVLRDLKGMADLARLLPQPGQEVHCLELMGGADLAAPGATIDEQARDAYRARILDLQGEIDAAQAANDHHRAERAELELDALVTELSSSLGLGGRARTSGSSAERARSAVTYRIRAALRKLDAVHPSAAHHLQHAVRTGTWCSYAPEHPVHWSVRS